MSCSEVFLFLCFRTSRPTSLRSRRNRRTNRRRSGTPSGTVATGRVEAGVLHVSDEVEIVGIKEETRKVVVTGIEMFRKLLDEAQAGDNIGALLRGVQRNEIERGQVLAKPGTLT